MRDNRVVTGILFFDGNCGPCTRCRDFLLRIDRTGDLRTEPLQAPGAAERLGVPESELLESVRWLDSSGDVYAGAEAASAALSAALGTRLPLALYRIPGVRWIEDVVYRWAADHRYRLPGTTPHCETHPDSCGARA